MERKHPEADCLNCPLYFNKYVPSQMPKSGKADIAIVGEAPGYYETQDGKPFVGASGKLLNAVLSHHRISREDVLVTNAVACRPDDNADPDPEAIRACRGRLLSELETVEANKVLAVGNTANESLLNQTGVLKLRLGRGRQTEYLNGVRIISTIHPAAVLRVPDNITFFNADVGKLLVDTPDWEAPLYTVADTEADALSIISQLTELDPPKIIVDIETHIEKDESFGQPQQQEGLLCIGIAYAKNRVVVFGENAVAFRSVILALRDFINSRRDVGYQNGKFDVKAMFPYMGKVKFTRDTMFMSYTLDEHSGIHSLDFIGQEIVGAPDWKHDLDKYSPKRYGYGVIPRPVLYKYNAFDCSVTWDGDEILWDRMAAFGDDLYRVHDFLVEAANEIIYVELNGIGVDETYLDDLAEQFQKILDKIQIKMDLMLPVDGKRYQPPSAKKKPWNVNPGSPAQIKEVFKDFGIYLPSTDEENCKMIIERKGEDSPVGQFANTLLEYRGVSKQKGTYVDGIKKRLYGGRVYTNFLLHGTTNGRLSSRNPNLQNIPRSANIKRLFVPVKSGNVFVQTDYSQAELRVLTWLSQDEYFREIFNAGDRDIFDDLSTEVIFPEFPHPNRLGSYSGYLQVQPDIRKHFPARAIVAESKDWKADYKAFFKDLRVRVKAYVYGLGYGRTEHGLSRELGIGLAEALRMKNLFFSAIPKIVQWQEWVKREVESGNDLISPFGRHRRFPLITSDNHDDVMREALSFLPSSTSSDLCLRAMCRVRRDTRGIAWVRNIIHDAILVECHESRVDEVREIMERHMLESARELVGDYVKFAVDTGVGDNWGAC